MFQRCNDNKWKYYVKIINRGRQNRRPYYGYGGMVNSLPSQSTPATTIHKSGLIVQFTGTLPILPKQQTIEDFETINHYRDSITPQLNHPLQDISNEFNIPHIITSIQQGTCSVVSDGSFFPTTKRTAAAYVIGTEKSHERIIGRCFVVGPRDSFSAYRAELAGIHGGLVFIQGLCKVYEITTGKISLACDNDGAISRIQDDNIRLQDKHFDYISAILTILSDLPITVEITQVAGHKDSITNLSNLSTLECMNVSADMHGKLKADINPPINFESEAEILHEWTPIKIKNVTGESVRIHSNFEKELYEHITAKNSQSYWKNKMNIPDSENSEVNWVSLSAVFKNLTPNKRKEVLKWHSGFCGTNQMLFRRKQSTTPACPGCNQEIETTEHILKCKTSGATAEWNNSMAALQSWMDKRDAAPEVTQAIISGLETWRSGDRIQTPNFSLPYLSEAFTAQNKIGWKGLLYGFTSTKWASAQHLHLQFKKRKITGERWVAALIRKLWETIWAMWRFRNSLVHNQTNTPLSTINALLNITMLKELQFG